MAFSSTPLCAQPLIHITRRLPPAAICSGSLSALKSPAPPSPAVWMRRR